jgi:hypothetical protein
VNVPERALGPRLPVPVAINLRWNRRHFRGLYDRSAECVCLCSKGGVFPVQQVLASPWRKSVSAGGDVQRVLQPYAAADQDFIHEGQRPYASANQTSPPCWVVVIPQDPSGEPDLTPDSPRSRTPASRNRNYLSFYHCPPFWQVSLTQFSLSDL